MEYEWIDFVEWKNGRYEPTDKRPAEETLAAAARTFELRMREASPHFPGRREKHLVPGRLRLVYKADDLWDEIYPTSEAAVMAHVEDLCEIWGIPLKALWKKAYPYVPLPGIDHTGCGRPAYKEDWLAVCADLETHDFAVLGQMMSKMPPARL